MCTLALYTRVGAAVPLLVAANRDEFLDRATAAPRLLSVAPWIVAGQDLVAGGTWLGLNERGLVVGLLNRRSVAAPDATLESRGLLCLRALQCGTVDEVADLLRTEEGSRYNPFTLLAAARDDALVGVARGDEIEIRRLQPGLHLLTNLEVNDPNCPRIQRSLGRFIALQSPIGTGSDGFVAELRSVLSQHTAAGGTPSVAYEDGLCIHRGPYGTRSSSIIALDSSGSARYWHAEGPPCRSDYAPVAVPADGTH